MSSKTQPDTARNDRGAEADETSTLIQQTHAWCRQHGFKAVRLRHQDKAAVDPGFANADPSFTEFRPGEGIGVVLGPERKGPSDVDLDCAETVALAPAFLPSTPAIFGRKSKRRSHWLYKTAELHPRVLFTDPTLEGEAAVLLELRGDGGLQTVLPGSFHRDTGEPIGWDGAPLPSVPEIGLEPLLLACKKTAAAALIVRHVWHEGIRNEAVKHLPGMFCRYGWTVEEAESFLTAVMDHAGDDRKDRQSRIKTIRATFHKFEADKPITGGPSLTKLLGDERVVKQLHEWFGPEGLGVVEEYNERYAVVMRGGRHRIAVYSTDPEEPGWEFVPESDFVKNRSVDWVTVDSGPKQKVRLWLGSRWRRQYASVRFRPGEETPDDVLNLWPGWGVVPLDAPEKCAAWLELLRTVICGGDERKAEWLLAWFADIFQNPCSKPGTAPVINSDIQGTGKNLLLEYLGELLGRSYYVISSDHRLVGNFNRFVEYTLLMHSNEAVYPNNPKHKGIIKAMITDVRADVEPKNVDAYNANNYMRLVLTTNEARAVPVERGDRRFCIFNMGDRDPKQDQELFERVLTEMKSDGPGALLHLLLHHPYDRKLVRSVVEDEAHAEQKQLSLEPVPQWWWERLQEGTLLPGGIQWAMSGVGHDDPWPQRFYTLELYEACLDGLKRRNQRYLPTETSFWLELRKLVFPSREGATAKAFVKKTTRFSSKGFDDKNKEEKRGVGVHNLPPLPECRRAFEAWLRASVTWPDEEQEGEEAEY